MPHPGLADERLGGRISDRAWDRACSISFRRKRRGSARYLDRSGICVSCSQASSGPARWAARSLRTFLPIGASTPGAAAPCVATPITVSDLTGPFGAVIGGRSLFQMSAELRVGVTDTIGIVPFFDAGNASCLKLSEFQRAAL